MATLFPTTPATQQSVKPPRIILWKWTLIATGLCVTFLLWECGSGIYQGYRVGDASVHHFHQELNDGKYDQICQEADAAFRESEDHDKLVAFFRGVHSKLGNVTAEKLNNINVNASTSGTRITTSYTTTFTAGTADETFTWAKSGRGLKLLAYDIRSSAFVLQ
jgi:hypothetical protein